jgi:type IV secretion system protein VirB5
MSNTHRGSKTGALLIAVWLALGASGPVRAQLAVIDVASVAHLIQQAQILAKQLQQAEEQVAQAQVLYQSMTGTRGMQNLMSATTRNYLPGDWSQLMSATQNNTSFGALTAGIQAALAQNSVLTTAQVAALAPAAQSQINAVRNNVALLESLAQQALSNSSARFNSIGSLIQAISSARDQKGILDLQARIGAEQGMLQNEQTKLQTLYWAVSAQAQALQQRQQELGIAAQGSFATRFEPVP